MNDTPLTPFNSMSTTTYLKPVPPNADRDLIPRARRLLCPSPRRSIHEAGLPKWFCKAVCKAYTVSRNHSQPISFDVLAFLKKTFPEDDHGWGWLDHVGRTNYFGNDAFVSEPYGVSLEQHNQIHQLAQRIGCGYAIDPNSWHFPGRTWRIVFFQLPAIIPSDEDRNRKQIATNLASTETR